jgi:hypothetical protein
MLSVAARTSIIIGIIAVAIRPSHDLDLGHIIPEEVSRVNEIF